jgi:hypothetical protein
MPTQRFDVHAEARQRVASTLERRDAITALPSFQRLGKPRSGLCGDNDLTIVGDPVLHPLSRDCPTSKRVQGLLCLSVFPCTRLRWRTA